MGSFAISGLVRTHAHMIQADPAGRFVLHVDLGPDRIFVWRFDEQKGTLALSEPPAVALPPGDGPLHLAFHPGGRWLYSIQEESSTIVLFDCDAATGRRAGHHRRPPGRRARPEVGLEPGQKVSPTPRRPASFSSAC